MSTSDKRCAILIIAHKDRISEAERLSLSQCCNVLGSHPIFLICPIGLDVDCYKEFEGKVSIDFINPKWQATYRAFNRLKIMPFLYRRYSEFDYVLFYELDAFVFRDELMDWCEQEYDYIGAPLYDQAERPYRDAIFRGGGNGGFSLRKVESMLRVTSTFRWIEAPWRVIKKEIKNEFRLSKSLSLVKHLLLGNNTHAMLNDYARNEDQFWSKIVPQRFRWFKVPDAETSRFFAVEKYPKEQIKEMDGKLPFGCHAWEKWDPQFWAQYIPDARKNS